MLEDYYYIRKEIETAKRKRTCKDCNDFFVREDEGAESPDILRGAKCLVFSSGGLGKYSRSGTVCKKCGIRILTRQIREARKLLSELQ